MINIIKCFQETINQKQYTNDVPRKYKIIYRSSCASPKPLEEWRYGMHVSRAYHQPTKRHYTPVIYKLAVKTISRFIALEAVSIFLQSAEFPIIDAAFLNSLQVSSNLTMVRTIIPSGTSVSSHMSANGVPCQINEDKLTKSTTKKHKSNWSFFKANLSPFINHFNQAKLEILSGIVLWVYWKFIAGLQLAQSYCSFIQSGVRENTILIITCN